jgi:hypothetical protein
MIAALHHAGVAAALHDLVPAMAADIDEACQPALVAHHDDRHVAGVAGHVVAYGCQLCSRTDVVPAPAKDMPELALGD